MMRDRTPPPVMTLTTQWHHHLCPTSPPTAQLAAPWSSLPTLSWEAIDSRNSYPRLLYHGDGSDSHVLRNANTKL